MKKVKTVLVCLFATAALFGAPKKNVDDWAADVENVIGPVEWSFKANFSKAKTLKLDKLYNVDTRKDNQACTIVNPMATEDNTNQFGFLRSGDIGVTESAGKINDLKNGDVFITYEGEYANVSHIWVLKQKRLLSVPVRLEANGGFYLEGGDDTVLKYRGWSRGDSPASRSKGVLQGVTRWFDGANFYSDSNPTKGEFSILLIDTYSKDVREYQLLYLGSSKQVNFVQSAYDSKYAGKEGDFVLEEKKNNDGYVYFLTKAGLGLEPYVGTSIFCDDPDNKGWVRNVMKTSCSVQIAKLLSEGKFSFFLLDGEDSCIILNEVPYK